MIDAAEPQTEGFDINLFSEFANIEPENFWYCARNELLIWAFRKYFSKTRNFFEIGCGTGFVLQGFRRAFPQLALHGSDLYEEALPFILRRVPEARVFWMDARQIPFQDEFDVIGAFDVLEHIEKDEKVLSQMYQAVKPGGGILLTVLQHPFLWSQFDSLQFHFRRYRVGELEEKVRRAGFRIVRRTSFVSLLLPVMILSRLPYLKKDSQKSIPMGLHRKGPVNSFLNAVMAFERVLIRAGVSFPVGGSFLLVAVKDPA